MIKTPTLFILGAGASKPYGYLTGAELRADIINNLIIINDIVLADKSDNSIALSASVLIHKLNFRLQIKELLEILFEIKEIIFTKNGAIAARGYLKSILRDNVIRECAEIELLFTKLNVFSKNQNQEGIHIQGRER